MILETDIMLKHVGINMNFIERPDLKHTDSSVIYLPFRVCEDCYLLFETMNEVKNSQIEISNFLKIPVDHVNFGIEIYSKQNNEDRNNQEQNNIVNTLNLFDKNNLNSKNNNIENNFNNTNKISQTNENLTNNTNLNSLETNDNFNKTLFQKKEGKNYLYRFLIMFTDIFWNEIVPIPEKDLYIIFNLFGNWYKIKLYEYYYSMDYFNINFFKMFYVICEENHGFTEYIDKNRQLLVKIGHFNENPNRQKQLDLVKIFKKEIIIEDLDICNNYEEFETFCSVELSLNSVRCAEKYRNTLNGLLFKEEKPHYVGKLRCLIRVNKEKEINVDKINCRKHLNVSESFNIKYFLIIVYY
jgi:hypothetical protein